MNETETICANEVICDGVSRRVMEVQEPEKRPNEELKPPANTAAIPEESKSSIQEPSKGEEFESQPEPEAFSKDFSEIKPSEGQEFESQPEPEAFSKDSEIKPYPEGFNKGSQRASEREGLNEDSDNKPYPEGFKQVLGQKPEGFNEDSGSKPCLENLNKDSASKSSTFHDSERESDLHKPVDESVLQELKDLDSNRTPTPRTSTSSPNKVKPIRKKKGLSMVGQKICKCAASSAADCAAVCCCPCVLAHLLVLALVKVPSMIAMKVFRYTKRKARISKKKKSGAGVQDEDASGKKVQSYKSGWSLSTTPHFSGSLEGSPGRTAEQQKAESQKFWKDLYADGHMGFGSPALERD